MPAQVDAHVRVVGESGDDAVPDPDVGAEGVQVDERGRTARREGTVAARVERDAGHLDECRRTGQPPGCGVPVAHTLAVTTWIDMPQFSTW